MTKANHDSPVTLEAVSEQFEQWRRTRKKRTAIPDNLWVSAIKLTENHSVNKIARNLRLNPYKLNEKIQQRDSEVIPQSFQPSFVGLSLDRPELAECTIELSHRNGTCIKAHIKSSSIDLPELSKIFLGCIQ
jgi:hypothetical protein